MLHLYTGTDTEAARGKMNAAIEKAGKGAEVIRITDVHSEADLEMALQGGGMFGGKRIVILDGVLTNEMLRERVIARIPEIGKSADTFYIFESAPDAATRKMLKKHAESAERYDAPKAAKKETIFALANALQAGKKKDLWVGYQRELAGGKAPEAIHGVFFWAAKQGFLRNPKDLRARKLVAELAELPHEARRNGFDLEYALERFVLSGV